MEYAGAVRLERSSRQRWAGQKHRRRDAEPKVAHKPSRKLLEHSTHHALRADAAGPPTASGINLPTNRPVSQHRDRNRATGSVGVSLDPRGPRRTDPSAHCGNRTRTPPNATRGRADALRRTPSGRSTRAKVGPTLALQRTRTGDRTDGREHQTKPSTHLAGDAAAARGHQPRTPRNLHQPVRGSLAHAHVHLMHIRTSGAAFHPTSDRIHRREGAQHAPHAAHAAPHVRNPTPKSIGPRNRADGPRTRPPEHHPNLRAHHHRGTAHGNEQGHVTRNRNHRARPRTHQSPLMTGQYE